MSLLFYPYTSHMSVEKLRLICISIQEYKSNIKYIIALFILSYLSQKVFLGIKV